MKKSVKQVIHLYDSIYRQNHYIFWGWSLADFAKYLRDKYDRELNESQANGKYISFIHNGYYMSFIWIKKNNPIDMICSLSHEANHATFYTLSHRGVKFEEDNHEMLTYYQEHIVRSVLQEIME